MSTLTFRNFDLHLTSAEAGQMRVEVLASPAGEAVAHAPAPALTIDDLLAGSGEQIGAALLPGAVRQRFEVSRRRLAGAPALASCARLCATTGRWTPRWLRNAGR